MSATCFGGSLNLVRSNDPTLRNAFKERTIRAVINSTIPYISYFLALPKGAGTIDRIVDNVLEERLGQTTGEKKKDLLQILLDAHNQDPIGLSKAHVKDEMVLMMSVFLLPTYPFSLHLPLPGLACNTRLEMRAHLYFNVGLLAVIQQARP
jgi:hypothetical protein